MHAYILAGGVGTRLRPLTCDIPKPMAPILDRPVLLHTLAHLRAHGVTRCTLTLQYLPEVILRTLGDGKALGMELSYILEDTPMGTAGSIREAAAGEKETLLIVSGDALTDADFTSALAFHRERGAKATLILKRVPNPVEYGIVVTDPGGRILRFQEKPTWGEVFTDTANTGMYLLEPEALSLLPEGASDFAGDLFPAMLAAGMPLAGWLTGDYWCDIGSGEQYLQAQRDALAGCVRLESPVVNKTGFIDPSARVAASAVLETPVFIGRNVTVGEQARLGAGTVLEAGTTVQAHADLKRTVVGRGGIIGHHAQLRGCILSPRVEVKPFARLFEGVLVGAGALVGEMATLKPRAAVWPGKVVDAWSVVEGNIVWGHDSAQSLFREQEIAGTLNGDLQPDTLTHIAAALAGCFREPVRPALAFGREVPHAVKAALTAGLESAGAVWLDCGEQPLYMLRYILRRLGLPCGLYARMEGEELFLRPLSGHGQDMTDSQQRRMEQLLRRREWPVAHTQSIGVPLELGSVEAFYLSDIRRALGELPSVRVGLEAKPPWLEERVAAQLRQLGPEPLAAAPGLLSLRVTESGFTLTDEEGCPFTPRELSALPPQPGMEEDPVLTLASALAFGVAHSDSREAETVGRVYCPNTRRGTVLRELTELPNARLTARGVEITGEDARAVIQAEGQRPLFTVRAAGAGAETAEELAAWCMEWIRSRAED